MGGVADRFHRTHTSIFSHEQMRALLHDRDILCSHTVGCRSSKWHSGCWCSAVSKVWCGARCSRARRDTLRTHRRQSFFGEQCTQFCKLPTLLICRTLSPTVSPQPHLSLCRLLKCFCAEYKTAGVAFDCTTKKLAVWDCIVSPTNFSLFLLYQIKWTHYSLLFKVHCQLV